MCLSEGLPFDSWRELGCQVRRVVNCSAWWLGDWLVYGELAYGDRYKQAITDTQLGYQTLRNYAWVARNVPLSRRRDKLSFGHHAEVAALPAEDQKVWLAQAERLSWSLRQLRRRIKAEQAVDARRALDADRPAPTRVLKIDVPTEGHDRWQSAAEQRKCSVADWIIATLDRAASEELGP
ncbi:MAG: LmbU family transcriptional regulator [Pseudonocardiales bacterium]|nr:LmbU family transcriptional regulator [Pseudonocardiales bacterium]